VREVRRRAEAYLAEDHWHPIRLRARQVDVASRVICNEVLEASRGIMQSLQDRVCRIGSVQAVIMTEITHQGDPSSDSSTDSNRSGGSYDEEPDDEIVVLVDASLTDSSIIQEASPNSNQPSEPDSPPPGYQSGDGSDSTH
jgi:hypothetical protein